MKGDLKLETLHKPVPRKERIKELDIIRGFALIGVLMVNIFTFNTTFFKEIFATTPLLDPLGLNGTLNKAAALFVQIFAEGKFYTIFSFLFGLGFYIFMERAEAKGLSANKLFLRRLLVLYVFGVLHYTFVWWGDILHVYAIVGLFLMFFRKRNLKTIKRWIITLLLISTALSFGAEMLESLAQLYQGAQVHSDQVSFTSDLAEQSVRLYQNASLVESIKYRLITETPYRILGFLFQVPKILGMFLIGLYVGKRKIFTDIEGHLSGIIRTWRVTGLVGAVSALVYGLIVVSIIHVDPLFASAVKTAIKEITTIFISMFYVTSLILLCRKQELSTLLSPLRHVGQMALTNYISQCILCSLIFYGHGLGLVNRASAFACLIMTFIIYLPQIELSRRWLKKHQHGPLEYIWRKLTYL